MHVEQLSVAFVAVNADVNYPQRAGGIPKIVNLHCSEGGDLVTWGSSASAVTSAGYKVTLQGSFTTEGPWFTLASYTGAAAQDHTETVELFPLYREIIETLGGGETITLNSWLCR